MRHTHQYNKYLDNKKKLKLNLKGTYICSVGKEIEICLILIDQPMTNSVSSLRNVDIPTRYQVPDLKSLRFLVKNI